MQKIVGYILELHGDIDIELPDGAPLTKLTCLNNYGAIVDVFKQPERPNFNRKDYNPAKPPRES